MTVAAPPAGDDWRKSSSASCLAVFISISNANIVMLTDLANKVRATEPGTAEVLTAFVEAASGRALDLIAQWPS